MITSRRAGNSLKALVPLAGLLFSGCLAALPANDSLAVEQACLISENQAVPLDIEIARSARERSRGLMERQTLAPDAGMLFVYNEERDAEHSFWMYRTLIPLDIAYMDKAGTIRAIRQMQPCPPEKGRDCPTYAAGVPFHLALEMNHGYFQRRGFGVGDQLSMDASDCR